MAISKEVQKSSEMKFDGKLIKVTYDIADVNEMMRGVRWCTIQGQLLSLSLQKITKL